MSISAGANAWRKVKGVMGDRRVSCNLKGNVLSSCVTPEYKNALETMVLKEEQQGRSRFAKNNLARIIVGVKRAD